MPTYRCTGAVHNWLIATNLHRRRIARRFPELTTQRGAVDEQPRIAQQTRCCSDPLTWQGCIGTLVDMTSLGRRAFLSTAASAVVVGATARPSIAAPYQTRS